MTGIAVIVRSLKSAYKWLHNFVALESFSLINTSPKIIYVELPELHDSQQTSPTVRPLLSGVDASQPKLSTANVQSFVSPIDASSSASPSSIHAA